MEGAPQCQALLPCRCATAIGALLIRQLLFLEHRHTAGTRLRKLIIVAVLQAPMLALLALAEASMRILDSYC